MECMHQSPMFFVVCSISNFVYLNTTFVQSVRILIGDLSEGIFRPMTDQQVTELRGCIELIPNFTNVFVSSEAVDDLFSLYDSLRDGKLLPDLLNLNAKHFKVVHLNKEALPFSSLSFCPAALNLMEIGVDH